MQNAIQVNENTNTMFPRGIIESKLNITANQMDIIALILAQIGQEEGDSDNRVYTISIQNYADLKGYSDVRTARDKLKKNVYGMKNSHSDGFIHISCDVFVNGDIFEQYTWFSKISYSGSHITFILTPEIKEILNNLKKNDKFKVFAKLKYILPMHSVYSKRIYLMCREFLFSGERYCDTDWNLFLEKLQIPSGYNVQKIKERFLDKAIKEINETTDINVSYELETKIVKGGTTPLGLKFSIQQK